MTRDEIEKILREVAGDPSAGPVAEVIPAFADALAGGAPVPPATVTVDPKAGKD